MRGFHMKKAGLLILLPLLSACADGSNSNSVSSAYDPALRGEVEQQLAQSASRASNSLETLAMIQRARTEPRPSTLDESQLPEELRRPTTLEWSGPANEAVHRLASSIGYSYIETGRPTSSPGMVSLDVHDVSVGKALDNISLQVEKYATIVIDVNQRRIEYRSEASEGGPLGPQPAGPDLSRRPARPPVRHIATSNGNGNNRPHTGTSD